VHGFDDHLYEYVNGHDGHVDLRMELWLGGDSGDCRGRRTAYGNL
jgi:hypothetical protein